MGFLDADLLYPTEEEEVSKHKLHRLVQNPNSHFLDVRCANCYTITTVFSHAHNIVVCSDCNQVLCTPTGGKVSLTPGCQFRKKDSL